jgi:hypothetical protein
MEITQLLPWSHPETAAEAQLVRPFLEFGFHHLDAPCFFLLLDRKSLVS